MKLALDRGALEVVITDATPDESDAILSFGFERSPAGLIKRVTGESPYLDDAVARYGAVLQDMVDQKMGRRPVRWEEALDLFLERVEASDDWCLIGGASLAVRGVKVEPGDVDIVAEVNLARAFDETFADHLIEPTVNAPGFGWFGRAFFGARLEWLGNPREGPGVWSLEMVDLEPAVWRGHNLLVPALDVYLRIEKQRGRMERVEAIRHAM